jgi:hypothetical protein
MSSARFHKSGDWNVHKEKASSYEGTYQPKDPKRNSVSNNEAFYTAQVDELRAQSSLTMYENSPKAADSVKPK